MYQLSMIISNFHILFGPISVMYINDPLGDMAIECGLLKAYKLKIISKLI